MQILCKSLLLLLPAAGETTLVFDLFLARSSHQTQLNFNPHRHYRCLATPTSPTSRIRMQRHRLRRRLAARWLQSASPRQSDVSGADRASQTRCWPLPHLRLRWQLRKRARRRSRLSHCRRRGGRPCLLFCCPLVPPLYRCDQRWEENLDVPWDHVTPPPLLLVELNLQCHWRRW